MWFLEFPWFFHVPVVLLVSLGFVQWFPCLLWFRWLLSFPRVWLLMTFLMFPWFLYSGSPGSCGSSGSSVWFYWFFLCFFWISQFSFYRSYCGFRVFRSSRGSRVVNKGLQGLQTQQLTIIGRGWAKYRDLSVASRSIICRSRRLRQIIDLRDTDKSRYFAITEFNNCFIIR